MRLMPLQEDLGYFIAERIREAINPQGVGVITIGKHACMQLRGVRTCSDMVKSHFFGIFRNDAAARSEFMSLLTLEA